MSIFNRKKVKKTEETVKISLVTPYKVGLALSGGGARGFGHIGAIKAFEEVGLRFDYVTGTSAGSIVGAMYAAGLTSQEMIEVGNSIRESEIRNHKFILTPSDSSNIARVVSRALGDISFADLKTPFACVAVDLITGNEIVLNSGNLATAVSASCSAPIFFSPVRYGKEMLVDGGLLNNIPSDVTRQMGADYVVAVDLNSARGSGTSSTKLLDIAYATWRIVTKSSAYKGQMNSDVIIAPDLTEFSSISLEGKDKMVEEGYRATMCAMPEILSNLKIKSK